LSECSDREKNLTGLADAIGFIRERALVVRAPEFLL
jgi:hypothetical protein